MNQTNQIVTQKNQTPAPIAVNAMVSSYETDGIDPADIKMPIVRIAQAQSKIVSEGKALPGDLYLNTTKEVLAKKGDKLDFIAIKTFKNYGVYEKLPGAQMPTFRRLEAFNPLKELPYEWEEGGNTWRRDICINFYVMFPELLKKTPGMFPALLTTSRSSRDAGRNLVTFMTLAKGAGKTPEELIFKLKTEFIQGKTGQGSYFVFKAESENQNTDPKILTTLRTWKEVITKNMATIKVDYSDVTDAKQFDANGVEIPF